MSLPSEVTPNQTLRIESATKPILFHPDVIPTKRHPLTNLYSMPTKYGILTGGDNISIYCQDYSIREFEKKTGGVSTVTTTLNNSELVVTDYQERRRYVFDHNFVNPQIERLGDLDINNGVYFVLDKNENGVIYIINDDPNKSNTGHPGDDTHIKERELKKLKTKDIKYLSEIKRIGEYLMVTGTDTNDESKTRIMIIDKEGATVLSQRVNYIIDRVVTNQKKSGENKFIFVTTDKSVVIEELVDENGRLNFGNGNELQSQKVKQLTSGRNIIDVAISGDEIALAVSETTEKKENNKMISVIEKDGTAQIADKVVKKITGIAYLNNLPYILNKESDCLSASLLTI